MGFAVLGLEALDQARAARRKAREHGDSPFLRGKQLNLDFFVASLLPPAIALCKSVQAGDGSCLDEALFT
jgi:hypothetical protein